MKLEKGEDEAVDIGLGSEDAGVDEKLVGAAELGEDANPAKLCGGIGIVAGVEVAGFWKENEAVETEALLGGLGALCVFA